MKFRFVGQHTDGRVTNTQHGVCFYKDEPAEVTDEEAIRRLKGNVEFEEVADGAKPKSAPRKRRAKKA